MKNNVKRVFYIGFSAFFLWLVGHVIAEGYSYHYSVPVLLLWIILALLILFSVNALLKAQEPFFTKNRRIIVPIFLLCIFIIQMICGSTLRYTPAWDLDAVYGGAIEWVESGTFRSYYDYYLWFPNNLGGLMFFYAVFGVARAMGITDYFMVAMICNSLMSIAAILVTSVICRKLLGIRQQYLALTLFAMTLPVYFIAPVFYTDALSMLFPVTIYYFYLRLQESENLKQIVIRSAAMGLFAVIGMRLKFTTLIVLIAIAIDAALSLSWSKILIAAGTVTALILLGYGASNCVIYNNHLDAETAQERNTPVLHWVMMGLKGDGGYNAEDYDFTRSFSDLDERDQAIKEEIKNRVDAMGLTGLLRHLTKKAEICFGDGTFGLSEFLDDSPEKEGFLSSCVLYDGENYGAYKHVATGVFAAVLLLFLFSGLIGVVNKEAETLKYLVPQMAVFGLLLFLIFWEARSRYIINYLPMIFLGAVFAIDPVEKVMHTIAQKWKRVLKAK